MFSMLVSMLTWLQARIPRSVQQWGADRTSLNANLLVKSKTKSMGAVDALVRTEVVFFPRSHWQLRTEVVKMPNAMK